MNKIIFTILFATALLFPQSENILKLEYQVKQNPGNSLIFIHIKESEDIDNTIKTLEEYDFLNRIRFFAVDEIEEDFELSYIAIHSNYHGKGIGTNLVMRGISEMQKKGAKYCWVKTLSKTPETIHFYEKKGFNIYNTFIGRVFLYK
ncbi:MAG: GNAT family N-acetyltransferase, partial [Bacteroidetes bacterium]|nr:GNAT family N-acetyltransferase [Bacteroidota bacterium]